MAKQVPVRQCLSVEVSKKTLQVVFSNLELGQHVRVRASTKFDNSDSGLKKMRSWADKHRIEGVEFAVVMEATGVYHERCAYFWHESGAAVSVVLPSQSKAFAKSLNQRSKTDAIDARMLAQMGLERRLPVWSPPSDKLLKTKRLCRERVALQEQKTIAKNQTHARDTAHQPEKNAQKRAKDLIRFLEKQIRQIEEEIQQTVDSDPELKRKIGQICRVKGLGLITVATVVAETDGFALFKSKGQLVCFAGYDVVQRESGDSIHGATRISRKGNSHIRRALHFPALVVVKHEKKFADLFQRVFEKSFIKMKAYVAVQRKLLVLIYTLYKSDQPYDPDFETPQIQEKK
ncbi:MAG: IS110 family transposase [Saprospiraceae bacterium]